MKLSARLLALILSFSANSAGPILEANAQYWQYPGSQTSQNSQSSGSQRYYPYGTYRTPYRTPYRNPYGSNFGTTNYYYNAPFGAPGAAVSFGAPVNYGYGNGFYTMSTPQAKYYFWRAPSGYYYPWYHYPIGVVPPYGWAVPTLYVQGNLQPQLPPISTVFDDLSKFIEQAKKEGKLPEGEYTSLNRRLTDLMSKTEMLRHAEGGTLSEGTEADLRNDLDMLSKDIAFRLKS